MKAWVHSCPLTAPGAPAWVAEMNALGEPGWLMWADQLEQEAEEADREYRADVEARLAGLCECCHQPSGPEGLELDGGLALCSDCSDVDCSPVEVETAEDFLRSMRQLELEDAQRSPEEWADQGRRC